MKKFFSYSSKLVMCAMLSFQISAADASKNIQAEHFAEASTAPSTANFGKGLDNKKSPCTNAGASSLNTNR